MFLNYDFFKLQVYNKNTLISNFKSNNFILSNNKNYVVQYFEQIEYINKMFLDYLKTLHDIDYKLIHEKKDEIKLILNDLKNNNLDSNFECVHNNKKFIYFVNDKTTFDNDINNIFIFIGNSFNFINENINKIDYTYLCNGFFNLSLNINKKFIKLFKNSINIGYNSSSNSNYIGIAIGIPLYNQIFPFFQYKNEINNEETEYLQNLSEEYINKCNKIVELQHNKIINNKTLNKINNNFYLLNLIKTLEDETLIDLNKFDDEFYITMQDMKDYLNNLFTVKEIKNLNKNIYLNENNYILIDTDSLDLYIMMYFQKLFYKSFEDYISNKDFTIKDSEKRKLNYFYSKLKLKFDNEEKINKNMINKNETLGNFLAINVKQEKLKMKENNKLKENDLNNTSNEKNI